MGWWVNDPNMKRSTSFRTKRAAKSVARNVKGASVSKTPKPQHSGGWLSCMVIVVAFVVVVSAPAVWLVLS